MHIQSEGNETSNRTVYNTLVSVGVTTILPTLKSNLTSNCDDSSTKTKPTSSYDALLYIVVVLSFYACSMVILMIKYVRREQEEAEMAHYYSEFVARERFKSPKFQVKQYMKVIAENDKEASLIDSTEEFVSCLDVEVVDDNFVNEQETKTEV